MHRITRLPTSPAWVARLIVVVPTAAVTVALVWGVTTLTEYGFVLFCWVPFLAGLAAVLLRGRQLEARVTAGEAVVTSLFAGAVVSFGLLAWGIEGLICVLMAMPQALPCALVGGLVGCLLQKARPGQRISREALLVVGLLSPVLLGAEILVRPEPSVFAVETSIEVAAPPDIVWKRVVAFSELPPPQDWVFTTGIAYPIRAEIEGEGVGAMRRCVFSTGTFLEPITVWDPPRRLAFDVLATPAPMEEWNPFHDEVHPPHLEGFLVSESGEFRLERFPGRGTRLVGTTWYRHGLWPAIYWRWWSDFLIHRIHLRVLRHIRSLSERDAAISPLQQHQLGAEARAHSQQQAQAARFRPVVLQGVAEHQEDGGGG